MNFYILSKMAETKNDHLDDTRTPPHKSFPRSPYSTNAAFFVCDYHLKKLWGMCWSFPIFSSLWLCQLNISDLGSESQICSRSPSVSFNFLGASPIIYCSFYLPRNFSFRCFGSSDNSAPESSFVRLPLTCQSTIWRQNDDGDQPPLFQFPTV